MKIQKVNLFIFSVVLIGLLGFSAPVFAGNVTLQNPLTGVNDFDALIKNIISYITKVAGALAILMLVIAGIFFVISAGNPEKISTAKNIALYAIIGLAIALAGAGLIEVIKAVIAQPT